MKYIMEKIKGLFQKDIDTIKFKFDREKLKVFFVTIITFMVVHFSLYALMITGPDTLINSIYHTANVWEVQLLRFGLCAVQMLKGFLVSPVLSTLICSVLLGITNILIIDIFKIKNKYFKYLLAIILAVAPNISATLTFFYCSDAYILGFLLATLAVFLVRKYEDKKWIIFVSSFLIAISMGMYQTYLSVTMVLCVATLIMDVLNNVEKNRIFKNIFRYILMGVIGVVGFYAISQLVLKLSGLQAANYSGANKIGFETLLTAPSLIPQAYQSFFNYFFNDNMIPNTIWGTNVFYIIIFAIMFVSIIYIVMKNKVYKNVANFIILLISIAIAPICFGIIEIIVPDVDIHILMACSMILVFPVFFKILELLPKATISNVLKYIVIGCSLIITWIYIWQDNASYNGIYLMQNQTVATANRIVTRIEGLDDYTPEMPVLLLGGLENNEYLNRYNTDVDANKTFARSWGFISDTSTVWWGNLDSWYKLLYEYVGVNLNLVSEWESGDVFKTDEYKNMTYYPEKDSITIINGTVVVKLSD